MPDDTLAVHPLAELFPEMSEAEFHTLVEDIKAHGLLEPIVLANDQILDGRHRYRACLEAGVEPQLENYDGDDPLAYITSRNLMRRHLTISQRSMVAAHLANMTPGGDQRSDSKQPANLPVDSVSQPKAAATLGVSERSVRSARRIIREAPELTEQIERGEMTVHEAELKVEAKRLTSLAESRKKRVRDLSERGHRPADIAKQVGTDQQTVKLIEREAGVAAPAQHRRPHVNPPDVLMENFVMSAEPSSVVLDLISGHYDELDVDKIDGWVSALSGSISALTKVRNRLKQRTAQGEQRSTEAPR